MLQYGSVTTSVVLLSRMGLCLISEQVGATTEHHPLILKDVQNHLLFTVQIQAESL